MPVDYDLVILGGSSAARSAAVTASRLKARVALVEPDVPSAESAFLFHHSLLEAGHCHQQIQKAEAYELSWQCSEPAVSLANLQHRSRAIAESLSEFQSLAVLAALGVDVIVGQAEFYRRPHLGLRVNGRSLRSGRYLLAVASHPVLPQIEGIKNIDFLTLDGLAHNAQQAKLFEHLVIMGSEPSAIELAQTCARLGAQVTLIADSNHLLPTADAEAARLMQAQLEADGIQILTNARVTQVKQLDGKKWVQAGNQAIEADEIVLVARQPDLASLNLDAAGVKWRSQGVAVNSKLQTTNSRIYACGAALGSSTAHLAHYEAAIALDNALFVPRHRVDYSKLPFVLHTQPELAQIGLTEAQAQQRYGKAAVVLQQFCKSLPKAQLQAEQTGFCKLIVHRSGKILGAHLVGASASETIGAIALAMQQQLSVKALLSLASTSSTWTELLYQTALQWQQRDRSPFVQNCLESWFNFRRSTLP